MIPFPGESLAINDGTGYPTLAIRAGSLTFPAPSVVRGWVYADEADYLEDAGADVVVSWVVEVLSGSGTIAAAWGLDPTYSDDEAATPTSLGSHAVTGAATLVLPTTITADDILNADGAFHLRLDVTAGEVELQQIKLRVWPSAGVAGGWSSPKPRFGTDWVEVDGRYATFPRTSTVIGDTARAAWEGAGATLAGDSAGAPTEFDTGTPPSLAARAGSSRIGIDGGGDDYGSDMVAPLILAMIPGEDWRSHFGIANDLVEGVDWVRPPNEVGGDLDTYTQPLGDGETEWRNASLSTKVGAGERSFGAYFVNSVAYADLELTPTDDGYAAEVGAMENPGLGFGTGPDTETVVTMPLDTDGSRIFVQIIHSAVIAAPTWPGEEPGVLVPLEYNLFGTHRFGVGDPTGDFAPIESRAYMPPYRVWLPTVVPVPKLRQLHRDDGRGVTPPRAFGGASRIRTGRAYGYD